MLHFCGLGYSRSGDKPRPEGGATSDHFIDLEKLKFEPQFEKYVRDAFSPVGIMLDYWGQDLPAGQEAEFKVIVINDLYEDLAGHAATSPDEGRQDRRLAGCPLYRRARSAARPVVSRLPVPSEPGDYTLMAELTAAGQSPSAAFATRRSSQRRSSDGL